MLCSPFAGIVQVIVDPQQQPEIAAKAERLRRWDIAWGLGGAAVAAAVLGCGAGRCCSSPGEHLGGPPRCWQLPNALSSTINIHCHLRSEYVVAISGEVRRRQDPNPKLKTGAIEITPSSIKARTCS